MRGVVKTIGAMAAVLLLAGFDLAGLVAGDQIDKVNKRLDTLIKVVEAQMQSMITAVPGERWLQHVDNVNRACNLMQIPNEKTDCENKKKFSQAFLSNVAKTTGIDPTGEYAVSIWVESSDGKPLPELELDYMDASIPNREHPAAVTTIQYHVNRAAINLRGEPVDGSKELYRPLTAAEVEARVLEVAKELFRTEISTGLRAGGGGPTGGVYRLWGPPSAINTGPENCGLQCDKFYKERMNAYAGRMRDMVMAPYATTPRQATAARYSRKWDVLNERQHLVIVMPEKFWEENKKRLNIYAVIHQKGDVRKRHELGRVYQFGESDFVNPGESLKYRNGKLVWGAHLMLDNYDLPSNASQRLREAQGELASLRKELDAAASPKK